MLTQFANQQKLMMLSLTIDGKPIAMKCNLLSGNGAFAWKITYDEDYARFSPGCILEKANIEIYMTWTDRDGWILALRLTIR